MSNVQKAVIILCVAALVPSVSRAQNRRGPSTLEERSKAVKAAALLESDPLGKDAKMTREWLTLWLIEVPDISVQVCSAPLGAAAEKKYKYSSELLAQTMFAGAAYLIEHPESASDRQRVNVAGVEGALRAYEVMVRSDAKARHAFLDQLVERQRAGELAAYVAETWKAKCVNRR